MLVFRCPIPDNVAVLLLPQRFCCCSLCKINDTLQMDNFKKNFTAIKNVSKQAVRYVANKPIHSEHEFSPAFLTEKARLRRSRNHLERYEKELKDFVASGKMFVNSHRRVAQAMIELVGDEYKSDDDNGQRKAAHSLTRAQFQLSDLLDTQITQIESVLTNMANLLNQEVHDARETKAQCYQALSDLDLWRSKVLNMTSQSKAVDGAPFVEAHQRQKEAAQRFMSLQTESIKKMAELSQHKNIAILDGLDMMMNMQLNYFRSGSNFCEGFDISKMAGVPSVEWLRHNYEDARTGREQAHRKALDTRLQRIAIPTHLAKISMDQAPEITPPLHSNEEVKVVIGQVENMKFQTHLHSQGETMKWMTPSAVQPLGAITLTTYRVVFSSYLNQANGPSLPSTSNALELYTAAAHDTSGQFFAVPLMSISNIRREKTEGDRKVLTIFTKDQRTYTLSFRDPALDITSVFGVLLDAFVQPVSRCFAFKYTLPASDEDGWKLWDVKREYSRIGIGSDAHPNWRISTVNSAYRMSASYPSVIGVPNDVTDSELIDAAAFRSKGRVPALSWVSSTGIAILRSSQPLVGITGAYSVADQGILRKIGSACNSARVNIFDARPRVNAVANAAVGGGWEDQEGYPNCSIHFLGLENIHVIREAFTRLRSFEDSLESRSKEWLRHIRDIIIGANRVVSSVLEEKVPCLVHCSDGWDRTSVLVSLAMLLLDPYYRTISGFIMLIEKEWLSFGHQFARRHGHSEEHKSESQRAPIFFQWIECVWQISRQVPALFEFNDEFLMYLTYHVTSCRFGTFLCDNERQRREKRIREKTTSLWSLLLLMTKQGRLRNDAFMPRADVSSFFPLNPELVKPWDGFQKLGQWYFDEVIEDKASLIKLDVSKQGRRRNRFASNQSSDSNSSPTRSLMLDELRRYSELEPSFPPSPTSPLDGDLSFEATSSLPKYSSDDDAAADDDADDDATPLSDVSDGD